MEEKNEVDTCREFGLANSATKAVWKNGTKIVGALEHNGSSIQARDTFLKNVLQIKIARIEHKIPI